MAPDFAGIEVVLHQPRWHGDAEWPPSPMRLFQALLAGICLGYGDHPDPTEMSALEWMGGLPDPPIVAGPSAIPGRSYVSYVPNNDLDAVGGDLARVGEIRDAKRFAPQLLSPPFSFAYWWRLPAGAEPHLVPLRALAHRLYQFGRGVDAAYARAWFVTEEEFQRSLRQRHGPVWWPASSGGVQLRCPNRETLASLRQRHAEQAARLHSGVLRQAAPAACAVVRYSTASPLLLFELRASGGGTGFAAWPLRRAHELAVRVRDGVAARLAAALPERAAIVSQTIIGRGAGEDAKQARIQIIPLPSIGAKHTQPGIRRVGARVPAACALNADDIAWAFSGLHLGVDWATGEVTDESQPVLVPAEDRSMLRHYGETASPSARRWRTLTPIALPAHRGPARAQCEAAAARALRQALRHAHIAAPTLSIRVQREPWQVRGDRVESFACGPRFDASRLWHAEILFAEPLAGPLVVGDGRYLGLGVMAPAVETNAGFVLPIAGAGPTVADAPAVIQALRRALMSRARNKDGSVDTLFSGHGEGPAPAASGRHQHVYLAATDSDHDGRLNELLVLAPWAVDRSVKARSGQAWAFVAVATSLRQIRAGRAGVIALGAARPADDDEAFANTRRWVSATPYLPTRHARRPTLWEELAAADLMEECSRRQLPRPSVRVLSIRVGPRGGTEVRAELEFRVAVRGPILLGRSAHRGGGWFLPAVATSSPE